MKVKKIDLEALIYYVFYVMLFVGAFLIADNPAKFTGAALLGLGVVGLNAHVQMDILRRYYATAG